MSPSRESSMTKHAGLWTTTAVCCSWTPSKLASEAQVHSGRDDGVLLIVLLLLLLLLLLLGRPPLTSSLSLSLVCHCCCGASVDVCPA